MQDGYPVVPMLLIEKSLSSTDSKCHFRNIPASSIYLGLLLDYLLFLPMTCLSICAPATLLIIITLKFALISGREICILERSLCLHIVEWIRGEAKWS